MSDYRSNYSGQEIDGAVSATTYLTGGIPANPSTIGTPTRLFVYNGKLYYFDGQTRHVIAGGSEKEQPLLFGDGLRKENGQTIGKVFCSTKSGTGLSGSMTVTLYDVPLVNGAAAPPSQWTEVESKTFTGLANSTPLEWTLTNPHTVQSGHTIGMHANKAYVGTFDSTQVSVTLGAHYFNNEEATTSSSISTNAYDFYVQAQS